MQHNLSGAVGFLRNLAAASEHSRSSDADLLDLFLARPDESAFAELLARHGPMVLGVCRRVLGNEHDAEEVCQSTFLTLARKAAEAPWQQSVEHWLRAVARRLALQARSSAERRRGRQITPGYSGEHDPPEPCDPRSDPLAEVARRELPLVLDEELGRLPEKYRAPVVLCYLEGKTNEQAAGELGWPAGSMSRRLARARALLHDRLTRLTVDNFYPHTEYSPEGGGPFTSRGAAAGEGAGLEPAGRCRLSGGEATRRFWLGLSRGAARSGCGATSTQSRARPPSPAPTPRRPVCR